MKEVAEIVRLLRKEVKGKTMLSSMKKQTPFQILISTVLSARTRDENSIKASKNLFEKYSTPKKLANAKLSSIKKLIKTSGFYNVKAKRVKEIAKEIEERFNGRVPRNIEGLLSLKGVGRKTANCVLVYAFESPAIPVDTHVHRISNRLGLVKEKTPEKTETALLKVVPKKFWIEVNELLVRFGQQKCFPRNPNCPSCSLQKHCDYYKNVFLKH